MVPNKKSIHLGSANVEEFSRDSTPADVPQQLPPNHEPTPPFHDGGSTQKPATGIIKSTVHVEQQGWQGLSAAVGAAAATGPDPEIEEIMRRIKLLQNQTTANEDLHRQIEQENQSLIADNERMEKEKSDVTTLKEEAVRSKAKADELKKEVESLNESCSKLTDANSKRQLEAVAPWGSSISSLKDHVKTLEANLKSSKSDHAHSETLKRQVPSRSDRLTGDFNNLGAFMGVLAEMGVMASPKYPGEDENGSDPR